MEFFKYHGTGNDFVIVDDRSGAARLTEQQIAALCHRRFGIGADGLMLLQTAEGYDFGMRYYNADGRESSMCGNGGRCIVAFAQQLGLVHATARFVAVDGPHEATIAPEGTVTLQMKPVTHIDFLQGATVLNTGSPHFVTWVSDVWNTDVPRLGRDIRNSAPYMAEGINVNFACLSPDGSLAVRTYERGVEDETMSCGTGVVASAIAATCSQTGTFRQTVQTPGGQLSVSFTKPTANTATDIYLIGPAAFVYRGSVTIDSY